MPSATTAGVASPPPSTRQSGTTAPSAWPNGPSSGRAPLRPTGANASTSGRYGARPCSDPRPTRTVIGRARASATTSRRSRVLPRPASPWSTKVVPRPVAASSNTRRSAASSPSRPTTTGHVALPAPPRPTGRSVGGYVRAGSKIRIGRGPPTDVPANGRAHDRAMHANHAPIRGARAALISFVLAALVSAAVAGPSSAATDPGPAGRAASRAASDYVPGELLVRFDTGREAGRPTAPPAMPSPASGGGSPSASTTPRPGSGGSCSTRASTSRTPSPS